MSECQDPPSLQLHKLFAPFSLLQHEGKPPKERIFFVCFFDQVCQYLGFTPGTMLIYYTWQCSGDHMGGQGKSNPGQWCLPSIGRQLPCLFYCLFGSEGGFVILTEDKEVAMVRREIAFFSVMSHILL